MEATILHTLMFQNYLMAEILGTIQHSTIYSMELYKGFT